MENSKFTLKDFREALQAIYANRPPQQRNLVIYTGMEGMQNVQNALSLNYLKEQVLSLSVNKLVSEEEFQRLNAMLDSPDKENTELVKSIITELQFLSKNEETCQYNFKPAITVTQVPTL